MLMVLMRKLVVIFCTKKLPHIFNANIYGDKIMAQMRVKDQDLIVEQVVGKIETEQLELFNARKDVQAIEITIQSRIEGISKLVEQYQELAEDNKMETDALKEFVGLFQKKAG